MQFVAVETMPSSDGTVHPPGLPYTLCIAERTLHKGEAVQS